MNRSLKSECADGRASERWENEGGPVIRNVERRANGMFENDSYYTTGSNKLTLLPPFEHKEPADDDLGLPEDPIYTNYSKYMWTTHTRSGGVQIRGVDERPKAKNK